MDMKNGVSSEAQGVADGKAKTLSLADVKKLVARDLPTCISFLQACSDPDVQDQVAVFLHGKYLNALHKEELGAQVKLDV